MTNSLCIHYVAHHRAEVSVEELQIIGEFDWGEADPNERELAGPTGMAEATRRMVGRLLGQPVLKTLCGWGLDVELLSTCLGSHDLVERNNAQELFGMLRNLEPHIDALSVTLDRLSFDAASWGENAMRLPIWDRQAWLAPMVELLKAESLDKLEPRHIAWHFRYLRTSDGSIPEALEILKETGREEVKAAAAFAISLLSER